MAEAQADQEPEAGLGEPPAGEPEAADAAPEESLGAVAPTDEAAPVVADAPESAKGAGAIESSGDLVSDTLVYLARSLVVHVDDVRVEQSMGERGPIYRLRVNPEDMGRVIGKSGRLARSIRQVARSAAARAGTTAFIEIAG
jgi:hypothetical protein